MIDVFQYAFNDGHSLDITLTWDEEVDLDDFIKLHMDDFIDKMIFNDVTYEYHRITNQGNRIELVRKEPGSIVINSTMTMYSTEFVELLTSYLIKYHGFQLYTPPKLDGVFYFNNARLGGACGYIRHGKLDKAVADMDNLAPEDTADKVLVKNIIERMQNVPMVDVEHKQVTI
jgi:hypothetical protein